jgi:hypothetical protein
VDGKLVGGMGCIREADEDEDDDDDDDDDDDEDERVAAMVDRFYVE